MTTNSQQPGPGPGVDAAGRPVIDPTANVVSILEAAVQRQDDLRTAHEIHTHEIRDLQRLHDRDLREAESKRIDAIRAVDVAAVNRAAEVSAAQALTLATQVATSADTLRIQVATTATAFDAKLAAALEPISKDIADLRRVQYESVGQRTQVVEGRDSGRYLATIIGAVLASIGIVTFLLSLKK